MEARDTFRENFAGFIELLEATSITEEVNLVSLVSAKAPMKMFDLDMQYKSIRKDFLNRLDVLMKDSDFILGDEVRLFEREFAKLCGTKYAVGVNSGTDALFLSLRALGIGSGDEVIVPSFTFIATSLAVTYAGAKPVFVDIEEGTYNLDPEKIEKAITRKTKAIIPVHLFGLCADMPEITRIANRHRLAVIEDACQAHGAKIGNKTAGSIGDFGCFSFYPTKNLSAAGDAGLITTNSKKSYDKLLQIRDCGRISAKRRYLHSSIGYNSRLDNIQALYLRLKLKRMQRWNNCRFENARLYFKLLSGVKSIMLPMIPIGYRHAFHVFSVRAKKRKKLVREFQLRKIPYAIFYQIPLHLQKAHKSLGYHRGDFPVSEQISKEIISLPMHPSLTKENIKMISSIIRKAHNAEN